jgi:hypothetical protein
MGGITAPFLIPIAIILKLTGEHEIFYNPIERHSHTGGISQRSLKKTIFPG